MAYSVKTTTKRELLAQGEFKTSLAEWLAAQGELVTFSAEGSDIVAVFKASPPKK